MNHLFMSATGAAAQAADVRVPATDLSPTTATEPRPQGSVLPSLKEARQ